MIADCSCQNPTFDIPTFAYQVLWRICMRDSLHVLLDDGTFVQIAGHVMGGGPDQLDAAREGLVLRARALESGEGGVEDVGTPSGKLAGK